MPRGTSLYDEAALQRRLWTPQAWAGTSRLAGWWDASVGPFTYSPGNGVSQWNDRSGNNRHATQATAANMPGLAPIGWADTRMCGQTLKAAAGGSTELGGFSAPAYSGSAGISAQAAINNSSAATTRTVFCGNAGAPQLRLESTNVVGIVRSTQLNIQTGTTAVSGGHHIIGMDAATNLSRTWLDGAFEQQASVNPSFSQPVSSIYYNGTDSSEFFDSYIAEIVLSATILSAAETAKLVGYLAWKWGTGAKLVASHAFKNRPPLIGD